MNNYPNNLLRGISSLEFISKNNIVLAGAFQFSKNVRDDLFRELSIIWMDNEAKAFEIAFNQRKSDNKIQFCGGVAILELDQIKHLLKKFIDSKQFCYERRPLDNNEYHGNLLLSNQIEKQEEKLICNGLALISKLEKNIS